MLPTIAAAVFALGPVAAPPSPAEGAPPEIVALVPSPGDVAVDPALTELRVTFDRDMNVRGYSWTGGGPSFPETTGRPRWVDARTCVLPVRLVPDRTYSVGINGGSARNFRSADGVPVVPVPVVFRTAGDAPLPALAPADTTAMIAALRRAIGTQYSYRDRLGLDWNEQVARHRPALEAAGNPLAFALAACRLLDAADDPHISVRIDGMTLSPARRPSVSNDGGRALAGLVPGLRRMNEAVVIGRFDDGIGYLRIETWSSRVADQIRAAQDALDRMLPGPGLVIDVRANGGGDETLAREIAGRFVEAPVVYATHDRCDGDGGFTAVRERTLRPTRDRRPFRGPVAVLMGGRNMSSCEAFLLMMRQAPKATLVGARSYGSSGNPRPVELGHGVSVVLPSWRAMDTDGRIFEGVGVAPDVVVPTTPADFTDGDPVLATALATLRDEVDAAAPGMLAGDDPLPRILVFSRTAGFRHESIPEGIEAIERLGEGGWFDVDATEDPTAFADENLARYAAVVFNNTTGDVLDDDQQAAFERYIRGGGGYVGIHAAADTEYDWPWYGRLVGAWFKGHPRVQAGTVLVTDRRHPSTSHLPERWPREDEWYDYRASPRGDVHVLAWLDETTYEGGGMGHDHPIAWCHEFDGGRAWYTGGGHTTSAFLEPAFRAHLAGGIVWAAGLAPGDAGATIDDHYDVVVLDDRVTDPMELAVARNGDVVFVERGGAIKIWRRSRQATLHVGTLDVFSDLEDGLLGVTLAPDYRRTGHIYVYYSPAGDRAVNRLARLTLRGVAIQPESEVVLLEIPTQRDECCHSGGSLAFDGDGNLLLSTGDNTSPFASSGFTPIDERPGRAPFDAQKSAGNTHDLRGKILRITPQPDGTYTVPDGNLFPRDGSGGRPEIFVMGCRNPFRIGVDRATGTVYWGEVGPDAAEPDAARGPAGYDEFNRTSVAGNFGWPYAIGPNETYGDHDFATGATGPRFDAAAPRNESPNSTGAVGLPPAQPAWMWYPYGPSGDFPWFGEGGRCAMAGPVFRVRDAPVRSLRSLPNYYDGCVFLYEWARDWIMAVKLDRNGDVLAMHPFAADLGLKRPHDLELGPDGCLYAIEWGTGFGGGNPDARIVRIEHYADGRRPPVATLRATPETGPVPLRVALAAAGSRSRADDPALAFAWDLDRDGAPDATGAEIEHVFTEPGVHAVQLTVTDAVGATATANVAIVAGNTRPVVTFEHPPHGGVADLGGVATFRMRVDDAEEGAVDPFFVEVRPALGHDTHAHPMRSIVGGAGEIAVPYDEGHAADADLFTVLSATFTDGGAPPLTGRAEIVLQPRRKQAEHHVRAEGIRVEKTDDPDGGGAAVVLRREGSLVAVAPMHFEGVEALRLRVAAPPGGGTLEARRDAADGPVLGRAVLPALGAHDLDAGPHALRVEYFERSGGAGLVLRVAGPGLEKQPVPADLLFRSRDDAAPSGLLARYYELADPVALPDFAALAPYAVAPVAALDFASTVGAFAGSGRTENVGVVFEGWFRAPRAGRYRFWLESDDGSRLLLDGAPIVDNDGLHGMVERSAARTWRTVEMPVTDPGETFTLVLVHRPADADAPLDLNWIEFVGDGVTIARPAPPEPAPIVSPHAH